jgi:hypothetical protein
MSARRPFGVTLVALIAWITGAVQILSGILSLLGGNGTVGVVAIVVGIVTIIVSFGLFGGNGGARILTAIVFALNVIGSVYLLITFSQGLWSALWSAIFPLIGLFLLFSRPANAFFARR